jgi:iron(III) transport system substrate-binding protein
MVKKTISRRTFVATAAAGSLVGASPAFAGTQLTVYTAYENDDLSAFKKAFEARQPDVVINWVRDSTGIVAAKLMAEKDNPRADVVWGLAVTNLDLIKAQGLLIPYAPPNLARIPAAFRDAAEPPAWIGNNAWICAISYNEVEGKKRSVPKPKAWTDLTNPAYRGQIVMPHPASSGTGFMYVSAWLQAYGEEKGWQLMDGLHENISRYTHSGSAPAVIAGRGESVVGLAFEFRASRLKQEGAPIDIVLPTEALGWEMNAMAIVKGTKKLDAAKNLMDWASSDEAMRLYGKTRSIVAVPGMAQPLPFMPADLPDRIMKQDFAWVAANRERILAEWEKRYGGKAEPRK